MFAHDLGHLWRGRRIHTSGHSDSGNLSNLGESSNCSSVKADTASAAFFFGKEEMKTQSQLKGPVLFTR